MSKYMLRYRAIQPVRFVLRLAIRAVSLIPGTTFGEYAEMAGRGPCQRCVGHAVEPGPRAS